MTTITIPKKLTSNRDLIAVPRDLYEAFLAWQEKVKSQKTFRPTAAERKAIIRGRQQIMRGDYITLEQLENELASKNRQRRREKH